MLTCKKGVPTIISKLYACKFNYSKIKFVTIHRHRIYFKNTSSLKLSQLTKSIPWLTFQLYAKHITDMSAMRLN